MRWKVEVTVLFLIAISFLGGCGYVTDTGSSEIDQPVPVEAPFTSISGGKCDVSPGQLFSKDGRSDFSECEIRRNSDIFNGKTVRISAKYGFMIHGSYLSSDNCELSNLIDQKISVGMSEDDWKFIDGLRTLPVDITAIGEFSVAEPSKVSDTIYDRTPYHFSIICLQNATVQPK